MSFALAMRTEDALSSCGRALTIAESINAKSGTTQLLRAALAILASAADPPAAEDFEQIAVFHLAQSLLKP